MLQRIFENEDFSEDEKLLTASSSDPVFINFLSHRRIEERAGGSFPHLVLYLRPPLSLSIRFRFIKPGYPLCLLLSNHLLRVYITHS